MGGRSGISGREAMYNAEISRRVEELRVKRNVQKAVLARAAGVSQPMLRAYEVGTTRWPVFRVRLIAGFLGADVEDLMPETKTYVNEMQIQEDLF
jgi:transcriptional regulator with XRE-family HTH domain